MKRLVVSILLLAVLFLTSCSSTDVVFTKSSVYYKSYDAVYDCEHEIGRQEGDGWMATNGEVSQAGDLIIVEPQTLKVGVYRLRLDMTVDFIAEHISTIVGQLKVKNTDSGEIIESFDVMRLHIEKPYSYNYVDNLLEILVEQEVQIIFEWQINTMVKIRTFEIASVSPALLRDDSKDTDYLMGEVEEDLLPLNTDNLYYFDLKSYTNSLGAYSEYAYDMTYLLSTLQGLVNRGTDGGTDEILMWMNWMPATDGYWLDEFTANGKWLSSKNIVEVKEPATLLKLFQNYFDGLAVWDSNVPATSNVAATICGVENKLPVRYKDKNGSIYTWMKKYYPSETDVSLVDKFTGKGTIPDTSLKSSGSAKNDAYLWAMEKYLKTGKTNPTLMAFHVDAFSDGTDGKIYYKDLMARYLVNKDYYIAQKAFFFDLAPWPTDGYVYDDPDAPLGTDYETTQKLLAAQNQQAKGEIITIGGFFAWDVKEGMVRSGGSGTNEQPMVETFSKYNCVLDAEAASISSMANASVYMHYDVQDENYVNIAKQQRQAKGKATNLEKKNYLLLFVGDFDGSAWTNLLMPEYYFNSSTRGSIPLVWPICAGNETKVGHVFAKMYAEQTSNDYFCYVNTGWGQFMPNGMLESGREGLYGSLESYAQKSKEGGERFDLDFFGFMGAGDNTTMGAFADLMDVYGLVGDGTQRDYNGTPHVNYYNVAGLSVDDWGSQLVSMATRIKDAQGNDRVNAEANFIVARFVTVNPDRIYEFYEYITEEYPDYAFEVVDPYTFFDLYKIRYNIGE